MRSDRGWFCLPEVDIHLPFTAGMNALVTARLTPAVAHEAMTTGRRYGGIEARDAAIVGAAVDDDQVRPVAVGQARALAGKDPATLAAIKQRLYREAVEALGA